MLRNIQNYRILAELFPIQHSYFLCAFLVNWQKDRNLKKVIELYVVKNKCKVTVKSQQKFTVRYFDGRHREVKRTIFNHKRWWQCKIVFKLREIEIVRSKNESERSGTNTHAWLFRFDLFYWWKDTQFWNVMEYYDFINSCNIHKTEKNTKCWLKSLDIIKLIYHAK